jgi:L,D-peptidoglycan transpeptidase YkuD (ErfK/YbiS/YcfS/YnhG family)
MDKPITSLPLRVIQQNDGWCDDPAHAEYNHHVKLPFAASHETLWREEHVYDLIIPIGFNDAPVVAGLGSAIFFHLAKPDYSPTLGCVAVALPDMLEILAKIDTKTQMAITPQA